MRTVTLLFKDLETECSAKDEEALRIEINSEGEVESAEVWSDLLEGWVDATELILSKNFKHTTTLFGAIDRAFAEYQATRAEYLMEARQDDKMEDL